MNGFQMNGRVVDPNKQSVIVELLLLKKTQARLQQKCVCRLSRKNLSTYKTISIFFVILFRILSKNSLTGPKNAIKGKYQLRL